AEVMHEHQAGDKVGIFAHRSAKQLAERSTQDLASWFGELVDGPFGPSALLLALAGDDPAVALEHVNRVVEGAEVEPDELVLMADAHGRGHLIWMHRPLVQQLEDRQRQG